MMFGDGFYLMRNLIYKMLPKSYCASSPIGHPLRYHDFILNPLKEFCRRVDSGDFGTRDIRRRLERDDAGPESIGKSSQERR